MQLPSVIPVAAHCFNLNVCSAIGETIIASASIIAAIIIALGVSNVLFQINI